MDKSPQQDNLFNVYIDEAGDEGFTIKDDIWVSSKWFVIGAFIVRNSNDLEISKTLDEIKKTLNWSKESPLHFTKLTHDKKQYVIHTISEKKKFRCTYVAFEKKNITNDSYLRNKGALYRYCCRFLLERVTWLVENHNGKANLIFENRSNTSYKELEYYIKELISSGAQIKSNVLQSFKVLNKHQSKNLQLCDSITSALYQALEPNRYGLYESSFIEKLKPNIYHRNNNYHGYGLKFFPTSCNKPEFISRYSWAKNFTKI